MLRKFYYFWKTIKETYLWNLKIPTNTKWNLFESHIYNVFCHYVRQNFKSTIFHFPIKPRKTKKIDKHCSNLAVYLFYSKWFSTIFYHPFSLSVLSEFWNGYCMKLLWFLNCLFCLTPFFSTCDRDENDYHP